jgi:TnpA family transposase
LVTAILADAINLGLVKMAEACPGTSLAKLAWLVAWHIRDETYRTALAELVNFQHRIPFAVHWGEGTTSSSDGQRYRAGGRGEAGAEINARYGTDPRVTFYTHISDQYAPFHTKVINATVRDATHVLDGLLHHESDLRIEEHYTDTSGSPTTSLRSAIFSDFVLHRGYVISLTSDFTCSESRALGGQRIPVGIRNVDFFFHAG